MPTENLAVPYHQQDTSYYCGAACAQMVLASIGAGLLDQNGLYADNHSHSTIESGWYTAPDGLQWTMNDRVPPGSIGPAGFPYYFALDAFDSEEAISRMICWTIHFWRVGPIAMVYGSQHWIVVRGYDASAAPGSSGDNSYVINAFDVNNPWPPTPMPGPPPPHNNADGCGTGGMRGIANEHITYATWQADYMTGISFGHWNGKFVAICDPSPPAERRGPRQRRGHRFQGDHLIKTTEVGELAVAGLKEFGLPERDPWKRALLKTKPGEPLLVQRLDRLDTFYYIVPMETDPQHVPVAVSVDARFGDYRQAVAVPEHATTVLSVHSRRAVMEQVVGKTFELGERLGRIVVRQEAFCLYPVLVWRPCRESLSPFYPFYMYSIGDYRLFIRIDGAVFHTLHTTDAGI